MNDDEGDADDAKPLTPVDFKYSKNVFPIIFLGIILAVFFSSKYSEPAAAENSAAVNWIGVCLLACLPWVVLGPFVFFLVIFPRLRSSSERK